MATVNPVQSDLVTLEIDGQSVQAPKGSMIIEAADRIGVDIPRFCYHQKLSIAANCRMCLVDVEKAPKPLPACATPVADGMKVFTESRRAVDAQRGVMEFLLINHPLDCPICDQGGECELQDLAMGYGRSVSRFAERKRVVKDKNLGPLVSTDMTRCIHCTRCVRFLEEIAGTAELGGIGRGEHTEISTFVERNINSELSGNIIDLCPVGALTNKPFRFSARPWEMRARPLIGSHDCLGSNLFYHVRGAKIMRCVPRDNESVNECWLADRDRYSHFGLEAEDRLSGPKIKRDGQWQDCDWTTALEAAADALRSVINQHGPDQLGVLVSPRATTEEHFLLRRLSEGLGCANIDHRLRMVDTAHPQAGRARMDVSSAELSNADAIFLIGSNIRQDQPILGHRVRTAWRRHGATIMDLNTAAYDFHFDLAERLTVAPQAMVEALARLTRAAVDAGATDLPDGLLGDLLSRTEADAAAVRMVAALKAAERAVVLLGDGALNHPQASWLRALAECMAERLAISLCVLPGPANSQGAWIAGTVPGDQGLSVDAMLSKPRRGYLLVDLDPSLDTAHPVRAMSALRAADTVVAMTSFAGPDLLEAADVLLPMAAVPETVGSYLNLDGTRQAFKAAIKPPGQAREGWKILRRLGEMLELEGFDFETLEAVVDSLQASRTPQAEVSLSGPAEYLADHAVGEAELARIGDVPMFAGDPLVRRSKPLQQTHHADAPIARIHPATAERLGLGQASRVRVRQDETEGVFDLQQDAAVAVNALWLPSATAEAASLGLAYGPVSLEHGGQ
jgi:NADH-quinone oxidoreductase subunit G